jgi:hypothetical protein
MRIKRHLAKYFLHAKQASTVMRFRQRYNLSPHFEAG